MKHPAEHVPIADAYTPHRIALLEKALLGGAAAAFAIILSLGAKDGQLDLPLKWAIVLAAIAMPLLLTLYVAKDAILALKDRTDSSAITAQNLAAACIVLSLTILNIAIACVVGHMLGQYVALVAFLWMEFAVGVGVKAGEGLAGRSRQPNSDLRNTG